MTSRATQPLLIQFGYTVAAITPYISRAYNHNAVLRSKLQYCMFVCMHRCMRVCVRSTTYIHTYVCIYVYGTWTLNTAQS